MVFMLKGSMNNVMIASGAFYKRAKAGRARLLIDAAEYFAVLRSAILQAKQTITIIGWDIHSKTPLLVDEEPEDEDAAPTTLKDLLIYMVKQNPEIHIQLLLWDYTMLFASEREPLPRLNLYWTTPKQISICLDDALPLGACHHQKLVVIDDSLAFCGGIDVTTERWDTPEHLYENPHRVSAKGEPYDPFHDMMIAVNGKAAQALGNIARDRWERATCKMMRPPGKPRELWPDHVQAHFENVEVGISRTLPEMAGRSECREIERLYCSAIEQAEDIIYIENQYFTSLLIAQSLRERMRAKPDLKVILVGPGGSNGWLEEKSMGHGLDRFQQLLFDEDIADRIRMVYPVVADKSGNHHRQIQVHAKTAIIDDRLLITGSANLNNRSLGFDTECNVTIMASNAHERREIMQLRNRLLGEHLGLDPEQTAKAIDQAGSICALLDDHDENKALPCGRWLLPMDGPRQRKDILAKVAIPLADPERPVRPPEWTPELFGGIAKRFWPPEYLRRIAAIAIVIFAAALLLFWKVSPLSELADPAHLRPLFEQMRDTPWSLIAVIGFYVLAGFFLFPLTLMITVTAIVFEPGVAALYSYAGALCSAAAAFYLGSLGGRRPLGRLMGERVNRISRAAGKKGVLSVMALRAAPIAPFTLINLVCGATHIRFQDFLIGSAIGIAPGVIVLSLIGDSIWNTIVEPTPMRLGIIGFGILAWLCLGIVVQKLVDRRRTRQANG